MKNRFNTPYLIAAVMLSVASLQAVTWNNLGPDMNTAANWSAALTTGGNADFGTAAVVQPNLSSSLSLLVVRFTAAGSSGYTLTSTGGQN